MQILLEIIEHLHIPLEHESNSEYIPLFQNPQVLKRNQPYPIKYLQPLKSLWKDAGIQAAKEKGNMFALHDNASYFFDQLDKFWEPDYIPSDQDIIRCRAKTTGIVETIFHIGPLTYRMFDVGGQRSERKKWIHCFENVTAILFVVAISGYDQCLIEDRNSNQMQEGLMLFDTICNSPWFINTSMILFLNKIDIFKQKILVSPVSKWFPDFKGDDSDFEQTSMFFRKRFQRLNQNPSKQVYAHNTDATDTKLLQHVMVSVSDIILNDNINTLML
ncbi:guanine nucleotide binding protein, alpha subunit [Mucor mucedo]|uniref:guanine nucleotide binding protein, alpha subunit n=1 Tax=Mucor mucedo TaxID=29922 RepID=UPI00221EB34B|nr:guanine nucleotide binding protein, alpha subunit [Mucor mucedo]KAI7891026.1 guanine nucleotide binding protein, alpha subunit [Mucor mucedo]